jgi:hypothetical protein
MIIKLPYGYIARWNGGHYINFYTPKGVCYNCISFCWEKNNPTQLDALQAYLDWSMSPPHDKVSA